MMASQRFRWLFVRRRKPVAPPPPDGIGERLRAAIAADVCAKTTNVQTHEARVTAMIDDFFQKYGGRDAGVR